MGQKETWFTFKFLETKMKLLAIYVYDLFWDISVIFNNNNKF